MKIDQFLIEIHKSRKGDIVLPGEIYDASKKHLDVVYQYGFAEEFKKAKFKDQLKPRLRK